MKTKYLIPFMALALFSCENKEEPIEVIAPKLAPNTEAIKAFKTQTDRQMVIAMHYDWGQKPGYSLMNTPDSLDIIVLKNGFKEMNDVKMTDLKEVQEQKLTKVLISCDMQDYVVGAEKQIKNEYKAAKKAQDKKWEKAAKEKAEGKDIKDEDLKPSDPDEISAVYDAIKKGITEKTVASLGKMLEDAKTMLPNMAKEYGFNGFSIKLPYSFDLISEEKAKDLLMAFTAISGKEKSMMLIVENPLVSLSEEVSKANYIVASKPDQNLIETYDKQAGEWADASYFPSFDVNDTKLSSGFEDNKVFTAGGSLPKDQYLIKWMAPNKKGIAVYHSEKMYFDVVDVNGYTLPYKSFREIINAVNAQK